MKTASFIAAVFLSFCSVFSQEPATPVLNPLVEQVLQNINESEQAKTPNAQQSGTLPLNIDEIKKMMTENPDAQRWGGCYSIENNIVYWGLAIVNVPQTDVKKDIRPLLRNRAVLLAQNETALVRAIDGYLAAGFFDDTDLLQQAYTKALSGYAIKGTYKKTAEFAFDGGNVIAGVVAVLKDNFSVTLEEKMENLLLKQYIELLQQKQKQVQTIPSNH